LSSALRASGENGERSAIPMLVIKPSLKNIHNLVWVLMLKHRCCQVSNETDAFVVLKQ
jgi:hypothetical protein